MGFGGYHPYPRRFGGGRPLLQLVHEELNAGRGTAVDASDSTTPAWVENMAYARAITFDGHGVVERFGYQRDPARMTDFLPRWESILKITPPLGATDAERREVVRRRRRRFLDASALHTRVENVLREEMGAVFVQIEYVSYANSVINVPDASYPWGTPNAYSPWSSTNAMMLVLCEKPAGYSEGDYYDAVAKGRAALGAIMPAWTTWHFYRGPVNYPAVVVSGGPSRGGFYLDDEHNLDNCVFST